jgi:DNA replication protein DnaC
VSDTTETPQDPPKRRRSIAEVIASLRSIAEEHERRMATDPEYRAEHERRERERAEFERQQREDEAARARLARTERRRAAGIPERVIRLLDTPGALRETEALRIVRAFLESGKTFLVLAGGVGPGKTVAAAVAVEEHRGQLVKAMQLTRTGTYGEEAQAFWAALEETPLLALDDLGTEPRDEKGWAEANLSALLDERYDAELPVVITTNLPFEKFEARYLTSDGGRLLDRFREAGEFHELRGESMRPGGGA